MRMRLPTLGVAALLVAAGCLGSPSGDRVSDPSHAEFLARDGRSEADLLGAYTRFALTGPGYGAFELGFRGRPGPLRLALDADLHDVSADPAFHGQAFFVAYAFPPGTGPRDEGTAWALHWQLGPEQSLAREGQWSVTVPEEGRLLLVVFTSLNSANLDLAAPSAPGTATRVALELGTRPDAKVASGETGATNGVATPNGRAVNGYSWTAAVIGEKLQVVEGAAWFDGSAAPLAHRSHTTRFEFADETGGGTETREHVDADGVLVRAEEHFSHVLGRAGSARLSRFVNETFALGGEAPRGGTAMLSIPFEAG